MVRGAGKVKPVATAIGIAAAAIVVLQALSAVATGRIGDQGGGGPAEPNPDQYLEQVRPHLAITAWTDLQLLNKGREICFDVTTNGGDVAAVARAAGAKASLAGYDTPDEIAQVQNDLVFIVDAAIKWLCPEWLDAYRDEFPGTAPGE